MDNLDCSAQKSLGPAFMPVSFPWAIVVLGALLLMISNINQSTFGVFFKPIAAEFDWSRGAVSGAYAIRMLTMAAVVVPIGYVADRHGPRKALLPSFLLLGVGLILSAQVAALWQFYVIQGLLIGIAVSGQFVCVISTVAKWNKKQPGLALGIASAGIGLSSVIFPPLAASLIQAMGWRGAITVMGVVSLVIAVPASVFMKDPSSSAKEQWANGRAEHYGPSDFWHVLHPFLKNQTFLAIVLMFLLFYVACSVITSHLVNYVTDAGFSAIIAGTMMGVMGLASTVGRLAMGVVSYRIGARVDAVICCALVTGSLLLLSLKLPPLMWVSAVVFGIGYGGGAPLMPAIMGQNFGTKHLATMIGAANVGASLGSALGPWMGGFVFDVSNSYLWALALAVAFTIVALLIALGLPSVGENHSY